MSSGFALVQTMVLTHALILGAVVGMHVDQLALGVVAEERFGAGCVGDPGCVTVDRSRWCHHRHGDRR